MKKTIIILIAILINSSFAFGQTKATIKWGKEFKESKTTFISDIAGYDNNGFYTVKKKLAGLSYKLYLEKFDNSFNKVTSKKQKLKIGKKKARFEGLVAFGDNLFLITNRIDRKTKVKKMFAQKVNKKTMEPSTKFTEIARFSIKKSGFFNKGAFNYILSKDESKILVYYDLPYKKDKPEAFGMKVYDTNFKLIWKKDVTMEYEDWEFNIEDYELSNDGDVYITGLKYKEKPKLKLFDKRRGKPIYHYEILGYTNKGNDFKKYPVEFNDYFLTDMQVDINDNNDIVCGGFYSNKKKSSVSVGIGGIISKNLGFSIAGSYFVTLDNESTEVKTQSFKEFDIDFLTQNLRPGQQKRAKKKKAKGKDVAMFNYYLDDIVFNNDGTAYLIAEQYYVHVYTTTTTTSSGTRTVTHYVYHYNDIIVTKMDNKGDIIWNTKIAKKQTSTDDDGHYSSYTTQVRNNNLIIIFNDNVKNLTYTGTGKIYDSFKSKKKDAIAVKVEIDDNGKYKKTKLFSSKEERTFLRPKMCHQKDDDKMYIYAQRFPFMGPSRNKFGTITFK